MGWFLLWNQNIKIAVVPKRQHIFMWTLIRQEKKNPPFSYQKVTSGHENILGEIWNMQYSTIENCDVSR